MTTAEKKRREESEERRESERVERAITSRTRSGPKEASAATEGVLRNFAHFGEMITSWEKIIS